MSIQPVTHTLTNLPDLAPTPQRPVRIAARDLEASELLAAHKHAWSQVTYALDGVVRVTVGNSTWIVPPMRAIWIPQEMVHEVVMLEKVRLRSVFIHADRPPFDTDHCQVLDVSTLLRELIVALIQAEAGEPREAMLAELVINEVARSATLPIRVALPHDKRLKSLCETLIADPSLPLTLDEWARHAGASARTLARLFEKELGMSFSQWRQQVRLAHAAPLISAGMPLSHVAAELGYASQSAFSAMFKKTFGESPSSFFDHRKSA
jgi:AraC-like DNA-binding protein